MSLLVVTLAFLSLLPGYRAQAVIPNWQMAMGQAAGYQTSFNPHAYATFSPQGWTTYNSQFHPFAAPNIRMAGTPLFPAGYFPPAAGNLVYMHPMAVPHAPQLMPPALHPGVAASAFSPLVGLPGTGKPISLISLASFPPRSLETQAGAAPFSLRDALGLSTPRRPQAMPNLPQSGMIAPMRFREPETRQLQMQQPPQPANRVDSLTGAGFMQMTSNPGAPSMSSPTDPSGAFDRMHQSWIPEKPQTESSGVPSLQDADKFDGLTGAGFMALPDPGGKNLRPT